jgi:pimeloyl-ACP methyl ester carboxylesterase
MAQRLCDAPRQSEGDIMKISSNGIQLNITDTGVGDVALVFLHHWGGSSKTWAAVAERLGDRHRCVAIDARGAGESEAPPSGYSAEDHASDALGVIRALGLARYVLVGHSMGGKTSQVLAARQPEGLLGVALIASSPPSPMAIDETQRSQMRRAYAGRDAIEWSLANVLLGSEVSDEARQQLIVDASRLSPQATSGWIDVGTREDFGAMVARVAVPVVIVAGDLDRVDPLEVVRQHIAPHYPAASLEVLAGKGHLLPVEAPSDVAAIVREFAASL